MTALLAPEEEARLATLRSLKILDTPPEAEYDDLVLAAGVLMDAPAAYLTFVDSDRVWAKAAAGFPVCEFPRASTICSHAVFERTPFVVPDATADPRFSDHPFVAGSYGLQFYAGAAIVVDGQAVGTLCCVDTSPRTPSARQLEGLSALARQAAALVVARRGETASAEGERRSIAFLDHAPAIAFLKDEEGRMRFANRRHAEVFGYEPGAIVGLLDRDRMPEEFAENLRRYDEAVRLSGKPLERDEVIPLPDGTPRIWNIIKFPIRTEGETWVGGVAVDVTDHRAAEATILAQSEELARRNAELSKTLAEAEASKARHAEAEARFAAFFDHAPVAAFLKDAQGSFRFANRRYAAAVGRELEEIPGLRDYDMFSWEDAERFREADDVVRRSGRVMEVEEDVPTGSGDVERWRTLKFPVSIDGEAWLGGVGIDLTQLRRAEAMVQDQNAELLRRESALTEALQEAETSQMSAQHAATRFAQLFDGLPVACFTYGEGGTIHEWNAAAEALWGIRAEDALLSSIYGTVIGEENRVREETIVRRVFAGETVAGEERRETLGDGRERWLLTSTFPLRSPSGTIVGAVSANVDVTERKLAEEAVREAKRFAESMADSATSMLYLVDFETKTQLWSNRDMAETLGYGPTELRAPGADLLSRIVHPEDLASMMQMSEKFHRVGDRQVVEFEARFRHANGEWRWLWHRETVYKRKPDGSPAQIMGSAQDVTDRKRMEAELRTNEARFRTVVESLHEGLTVQNAEGKVLLWNPSAQRISGTDITGTNASDGLGTDWRLLREDGTEYDPDDMPIALALRTGEPQVGATVGVETVAGVRWLSVNASPLTRDRDGDGPATEAVSSFVDITERMRMETALRESEARFRTVVESLAEGLVVHDEHQQVVYWNQSAERILGMTGDQLRGLSQMPKEYRIVNEDGTAALYEDRPVAHALRTGQVQEPRTLGVHRPDGEFRWISVGASPVAPDDGGRPTEAVVSILDVTERYEQDRRLRQYSAELEEANSRLEGLATTDGLTGLKNHRFFQDWLRRRIEQCIGTQRPLSIALLDVDRFKRYNDDFGHQAGDAVLRGVAGALERTVRGGDLAARYGGEEFVLVLPGADEAEAIAVAERVRAAIAELPLPDRMVTASFGVATLDAVLADAASMIRAADEALYRSKNGGRNLVTHYRESESVFSPT